MNPHSIMSPKDGRVPFFLLVSNPSFSVRTPCLSSSLPMDDTKTREFRKTRLLAPIDSPQPSFLGLFMFILTFTWTTWTDTYVWFRRNIATLNTLVSLLTSPFPTGSIRVGRHRQRILTYPSLSWRLNKYFDAWHVMRLKYQGWQCVF